MTTIPLRVRLAATLAFVVLLPPTSSWAGDVYLQTQVVFVNMTPDEVSGPESRACVKAVRKAIEDGKNIMRNLGETKTRTFTRVPKGGEHFLTWKSKRFRTLLRNHKADGLRDNPVPEGYEALHADAAVLVDCRPKDGTLDIVVATGVDKESGRTFRTSLRNVNLTDSLVQRVGTRAGGRCANTSWHYDH